MIEENKKVRNWVIEIAGDGTHDSVFLNCAQEDLSKAFKVENLEEYIEDLSNEDNWDMYGVFHLDLEQAYIRVTPIRRKGTMK